MENHGGITSTRETSLFVHQSSLAILTAVIQKQEELAKETNLALRCISVHTSKGSLTYRESYDMELTALFPLRWKACYRLLSPLQIHRPRQYLNPRTLGPMASTLTKQLYTTEDTAGLNSRWLFL
jgi:hypothetical protein